MGDDKTLTPWGLATSDNLMGLLFQKLEEVKAAQTEISTKLDVHVAAETEWQSNIKQKFEDHISEHKAAATIWRKGAIGFVFMVIGSVVMWLGSFAWAHRGG